MEPRRSGRVKKSDPIIPAGATAPAVLIYLHEKIYYYSFFAMMRRSGCTRLPDG
jgi:hypothetical protein